jgi:hypothetical protein
LDHRIPKRLMLKKSWYFSWLAIFVAQVQIKLHTNRGNHVLLVLWHHFHDFPQSLRVQDRIIKQEVLGRINSLPYFHYILSILYDTDRIDNTASNSSIVACVFFAMGACLLSCCLSTAVSSCFTVPYFRRWGEGAHIHTYTHTATWTHKLPLIFFQNNVNTAKCYGSCLLRHSSVIIHNNYAVWLHVP